MATIGKNLDWHLGDPMVARELKPVELHLWQGPLIVTEPQLELALSWLSAKQLDRYQSRQSDQAKRAYLAGRFYLYQLLAAYENCQPNDICLNYGPLNKPYLSINDEAIEFNFTDTAAKPVAIGVLAFCKNHAVGVDIEALDRQASHMPIAKRRFTPAEYQYALEDEQIRADRFAAVWTCKEAFGKAVGKGINFKMNQVDLYHAGNNELNFYSDKAPFRLHQFAVADTHVGAVVHASHQSLKIRAFSWANQIP